MIANEKAHAAAIPSRADRLHAAWLLIAALATVAYWIVYFSSGATQLRSDAVYLGFESAFPLADGWMALCLTLAAIFLWRGDRRALLWGLCGASAMVFLGCIDLLFNIEQGHFQRALNPELAAECVIVAFCGLFGPFTIWRLWRHPAWR